MHWLCVDPGETTGWCLLDGGKIVDAGQDELWSFIDMVDATMQSDSGYGETLGETPVENIGAIICEDWSLYPWVIQTGALDFDKCRTARGIGALTLLARQHGIPFILQPATIKEAAVAAGAEETFVTPLHENRHQNDARMHAVFYLAKNDGKPPC